MYTVRILSFSHKCKHLARVMLSFYYKYKTKKFSALDSRFEGFMAMKSGSCSSGL